MNKIILGAALASSLAAFAGSASAQTYGDVARVISATPLYDRASVPRRECHTEQVTAYEERRTARPPESGGVGAGTVLGAIVGGVIGHQFGGSSAGRDHGTAAGAVVGGLVGNQIDRDADSASRDVAVDRIPVTREVQRCDDVADTQERLVGYDVVYEYNGHELRTRLAYDPGPQIAVNVDVRPPASNVSLGDPRPPSYRRRY